MDNHSPALFLADALALDFLNSIATPIDKPVEWLEDGEGLLRWLEQAGLASSQTLESMRSQALPGELDKIADQARGLREWFRAFVRKHKGRSLEANVLADLEPLNRLLERDEGFNRVSARMTDEKMAFELQPMRRWRSPEALLAPIAEVLGRFVCTEDFAIVKACEGPACTLLFADHTRGHRRRWCSMALCGNRAKQAAHRQRSKDKWS